LKGANESGRVVPMVRCKMYLQYLASLAASAKVLCMGDQHAMRLHRILLKYLPLVNLSLVPLVGAAVRAAARAACLEASALARPGPRRGGPPRTLPGAASMWTALRGGW